MLMLVMVLLFIWTIFVSVGIRIGVVSSAVFSRSIGSVLEIGQEGRISSCYPRPHPEVASSNKIHSKGPLVYSYIDVYIVDLRSIATTNSHRVPPGNLGMMGNFFKFRKREKRPFWIKSADGGDFDF